MGKEDLNDHCNGVYECVPERDTWVGICAAVCESEDRRLRLSAAQKAGQLCPTHFEDLTHSRIQPDGDNERDQCAQYENLPPVARGESVENLGAGLRAKLERGT